MTKKIFNKLGKEIVPILLGVIIALIGYIYINGMDRIDEAINSINTYNIEHQKEEVKQNNLLTEHEIRIGFLEKIKYSNQKKTGKN